MILLTFLRFGEILCYLYIIGFAKCVQFGKCVYLNHVFCIAFAGINGIIIQKVLQRHGVSLALTSPGRLSARLNKT